MYKKTLLVGLLAFSSLSLAKMPPAAEFVKLPNGKGAVPWFVGGQLPTGEYSDSAMQTWSDMADVKQAQYHKGVIYTFERVDRACEQAQFEQVLEVNGQKVNHAVHKFMVPKDPYCTVVKVPKSKAAQDYVRNEFLKKNVVSWGREEFTGKFFTKTSKEVESIL